MCSVQQLCATYLQLIYIIFWIIRWICGGQWFLCRQQILLCRLWWVRIMNLTVCVATWSVQYWTWAAGRKDHFFEKVLQNQCYFSKVFIIMISWHRIGSWRFQLSQPGVWSWIIQSKGSAGLGDGLCGGCLLWPSRFFYVPPPAQWVWLITALAATSLRVQLYVSIPQVDMCVCLVCSNFYGPRILQNFLVYWFIAFKMHCAVTSH